MNQFLNDAPFCDVSSDPDGLVNPAPTHKDLSLDKPMTAL